MGDVKLKKKHYDTCKIKLNNIWATTIARNKTWDTRKIVYHKNLQESRQFKHAILVTYIKNSTK